ncbi:hypothetical protein RD792_000680, partial [Penstemon davidsonii]
MTDFLFHSSRCPDSKELMYQQVLRRFAHFSAIQLSDPAPLSELIMLALKEEDLDPEGNENDDLKEKIAEVTRLNHKHLFFLLIIHAILIKLILFILKSVLLIPGNFRIMRLLGYLSLLDLSSFSFSIGYSRSFRDDTSSVLRLPVVLDQYTPDMDRVPEFVLCLGNDVDWDDEKICFQTIAAAIGNFYALHPPLLPNPSGDGLQFYKKVPSGSPVERNASKNAEDVNEEEVEHELLLEAEIAWAQREWSIQHVLLPSMRLFLKPPTSMATDGTFVK